MGKTAKGLNGMAEGKAENKDPDHNVIEIELLPDGSILIPDDIRLLALAKDLCGDRVSAKIEQGAKTKFLIGNRMCG
jgi:hypothetical protein